MSPRCGTERKGIPDQCHSERSEESGTGGRAVCNAFQDYVNARHLERDLSTTLEMTIPPQFGGIVPDGAVRKGLRPPHQSTPLTASPEGEAKGYRNRFLRFATTCRQSRGEDDSTGGVPDGAVLKGLRPPHQSTPLTASPEGEAKDYRNRFLRFATTCRQSRGKDDSTGEE
jgi:hypothetical protein